MFLKYVHNINKFSQEIIARYKVVLELLWGIKYYDHVRLSLVYHTPHFDAPTVCRMTLAKTELFLFIKASMMRESQLQSLLINLAAVPLFGSASIADR